MGPMTSMPNPTVARLTLASSRLPHTHGGMTGSAARRSTSTAPMAQAAAAANTPMLAGDSHGQAVPPCSSPKMTAAAAPRTSSAPG